MPSSRGDEGTAVYLGWLAAGLILLVLFVLAWRGTWRNWAGGIYGAVPLYGMPTLGALAVVYGGGGLLPERPSPLLALTLLASLVVTAIGIWDPPWFGPAWYREFKRRKDRSTVSAGIAVALRAPAPEQNSERVARDARRPRTPTVRHHASLLDPDLGKPTGLHTPGVATGHLLFYDDELVFAAEPADDAARPGPTIRSIPADTITDVDVVSTARTQTVQYRFPSVRIHTTTGDLWRFECIRAQRAADDIRRLYTGTRR